VEGECCGDEWKGGSSKEVSGSAHIHTHTPDSPLLASKCHHQERGERRCIDTETHHGKIEHSWAHIHEAAVKPLYHEALAASREQLGETHPSTLSSIKHR
jgi:hypothetical protein